MTDLNLKKIKKMLSGPCFSMKINYEEVCYIFSGLQLLGEVFKENPDEISGIYELCEKIKKESCWDVEMPFDKDFL